MKPAEQRYRMEYLYHEIYKRRGDYYLTLKSEDELSDRELGIIDKVLGDTLRIEEQMRREMI
jgi:hypothetical protein